MTIEKRIAALEAARARARAATPTELVPAMPIDQLVDQLRARSVEWAAEDERRAALPLEEQLGLLRADHAADVDRRATRTPSQAARMVPNYDLLADRLFAILEKRLLDRITAVGSVPLVSNGPGASAQALERTRRVASRQ